MNKMTPLVFTVIVFFVVCNYTCTTPALPTQTPEEEWFYIFPELRQNDQNNPQFYNFLEPQEFTPEGIEKSNNGPIEHYLLLIPLRQVPGVGTL